MTEDDIVDYHSCGYPLEWHGCYDKDSNYNKYITAESFAHPAKMSWGLLERIFKHLQEMRLVEDNTTIVDFMAGTFRTGVMAELFGYRSIGIELEPHFIKMIEGNRAQIEKLTGRKTHMEFMQGDARSLSTMLREKGCVGVVSPPYSNAVCHPSLGSPKEGWGENGFDILKTQGKVGAEVYSTSQDNIGNLKDAPLVGITSPPYADQNKTAGIGGIDWEKAGRPDRLKDSQNRHNIQGTKDLRYSDSDENIGNLPDRQLVGITSPPYESSTLTQDEEFIKRIESQHRNGSRFQGGNTAGYGVNPENLGNQNGSTYLSAMLQVYSEAFRSGISPLVLVTKNPTRNGKLRRLDLDTVRILQLSGYEVFDYHRAILFEEITQGTLDGAAITKPKGRLSFFKRLSYEKGNVVARWEDIIFARTPNGHKGLMGITSPPYLEQVPIQDKDFLLKANLDRGRKESDVKAWNIDNKYSSNPANIGNLPDKQLVGIVSPPYSEAQTGGGIAIEGYRGKHMSEAGRGRLSKSYRE